MKIKQVMSKRVFPLFLAFVLVFSQLIGAVAFPLAFATSAQTEVVKLVEWNFDNETLEATGGIEQNIGRSVSIYGAKTTSFVLGYNGSRAINSNGWHVAGEKYWQAQFSTLGFENIQLSSKHFGSASGPRDFSVQFSLDEVNWTDVGALTLPTANTWFSVDQLRLPTEVNDKETVYVRWLNTSSVSVGGLTIGSTGTNRIDDIVINGSPVGLGEEPIEVEGPISIADARSKMGQEVTIIGVANINQGLLQENRFSLYLQDGEAGIQLFNHNTSDLPFVKEGDLIKATGVVGEHNNVTQLAVTEVEVLKQNQAVDAKQVLIADYMDFVVAESYEGQLVTFEGYIRNVNDYFNGGATISIIDEDFNSVDIRVWESTGIDLSQIEQNAWYEITAISSQFRTTYQVLPRRNADIQKITEQRPAPTTKNREFTAIVERVVDGDTIRLATPVLGTTNVRFLNMDTAETYHTVKNDLDANQMYHGQQAALHLRTMLSDGDMVTLRLGEEPLDAFGRLLAEVITKDGVNTNLQMVRDGMAPTYFIYPFENEVVAEYAEAARKAREEQLGIWNPDDLLLEMPFVFRARERGSNLSRYVGNFMTKEYVSPDHYSVIAPEYRVFFSKAQGESLGYEPLRLTDQEALDMDTNALGVDFQGTDTAEFVTSDVGLATVGAYGSTIMWESSKQKVVSSTGEVTNPRFKSEEVVLTATIQKGELQATKQFTIVVQPLIHELVSWNFDQETPFATGGIEANASQEITVVGATVTANYAAGFGTPSRAINSNGWNSEEDSYWFIQFQTTGYQNIELSARQFGSNTGPRDFKVQYSIDNETWVDIDGGAIVVGNNWTSGITNLMLPTEVENKEVVYIRWLKTSYVSVTGGTVGSGGTNRIDDIMITGTEKKLVGNGHVGRPIAPPGKPESPGKQGQSQKNK